MGLLLRYYLPVRFLYYYMPYYIHFSLLFKNFIHLFHLSLLEISVLCLTVHLFRRVESK